MKQMLTVAAVAAVLGLPGTQLAAADDAKTSRGAVRATAPASLTVQVGSNEMTFNVDSATLVTARRGSAAMQRARANGKKGVPYTDIVKVGQQVEVAYHEAGMQATTIRVLADARAPSKTAAVPAAPASHILNAVGVVTAVSDSLLTTKDDRGELIYVVDGQTRVSGAGLGTRAREMKSAGERTTFSRFVHNGDTVAVRYEEASGTKYASHVRVTRKSR